MKKIVNKKLYNTETAELIYSIPEKSIDLYKSFDRGPEMLSKRHLYRTLKGNYFFVGDFDAFSVADKEEADAWLEKNASMDFVLKYYNHEIDEA